jgi:hypothetical protein
LLLNWSFILKQISRYSDDASSGKISDCFFMNPAYAFEIFGGIGQKSYTPSVTFLVTADAAAAAAVATRLTVDMTSCTLTLRPDLLAPNTLHPHATACQSALELCGVVAEQRQVRSKRPRLRAAPHAFSSPPA